MDSITVPASLDSLEEVNAFIEGKLEAFDCSLATQMQIEVSVEEIFVNIASYAFDQTEGSAEIRCDVLEDPVRIEIQILDNGKPFDPLARGAVDLSEEAIDARKGGLGIHLVKETMDEVSYSYENGKNILTIKKNL